MNSKSYLNRTIFTPTRAPDSKNQGKINDNENQISSTTLDKTKTSSEVDWERKKEKKKERRLSILCRNPTEM
jgi:predicted esterase YcpF (UPF0227 family)